MAETWFSMVSIHFRVYGNDVPAFPFKGFPLKNRVWRNMLYSSFDLPNSDLGPS